MKVFVVLAAYMHRLGHSIFPYIDDWLLVVSSRDHLLNTIQTLWHLLANSDVGINEDKSILVPTK